MHRSILRQWKIDKKLYFLTQDIRYEWIPATLVLQEFRVMSENSCESDLLCEWRE